MSLLKTLKTTFREIRDGVRGIVKKPRYGISDMDYDAYWKARGLSGVQPRYPILARQIEDGATVLDVGCGDGGLLRYLKDLDSGIQEFGIDISSVAIRKARKRGVNAQVTTLESLSVANESFDYVVMSEVIEHLAEPEAYIRRSWSLARRALLVTFPNIAYWPHRLRLLSGRFPIQWVHHPGEHLRFWSVRDFENWVQNLALPRHGEPGQLEIIASNGLTFLRLHRAMPNLFGNQIVFVARK